MKKLFRVDLFFYSLLRVVQRVVFEKMLILNIVWKAVYDVSCNLIENNILFWQIWADKVDFLNGVKHVEDKYDELVAHN